MSNRDSDDDVDPNDEQDEDDVDDEDEEGEQEDPEHVGSSSAEIPQRSTRTSNRDLYSYGANMTDKQKREQDERKFAKAAGKERKPTNIADSKRRIRFDKKGNLQYSDDPETSGWRECNKSS
jgi:hypothetical protein